jgi:hypothetical protein
MVCFATAARAQDVEFLGGYSYLRTTGTSYEHAGINGWNAALSANIKSWGVVADFSNHYGASTNNFTPVGSGGHGTMFLFGPQYSFRLVPRVTPFAHVLFGGVKGARETVGPLEPGGACPSPGCSGFSMIPETAFAMALGGGLDVKARNHLWIRLIQVDYIRQNFSDGAMNSPRISAGVVFRFGKP